MHQRRKAGTDHLLECQRMFPNCSPWDVELAYFFSLTGTLNLSCISKLDLFMVTSTKEGWINLYGDHWGNTMPVTSKVFPSERVAKDNISKVNDKYLATVKIEWEE